MPGKTKSRIIRSIGWGCVAVSLIALLAIGGYTLIGTPPQTVPDETQLQKPETQPSTQASTAPIPPVTEPTKPAGVTKESTATVGVTGDILLHNKVIQSGYDQTTDTYDYRSMFESFAPFVSQMDFAVANLEVTLCGDDNGYAYSGYPQFNAPDAIVDALKDAGFDMLLTANNHSYDTGITGLKRTQEIIKDRGLAHIGTRPTQEEKNYRIENVNGIQIGMINYTYNTGFDSKGNASLNGHPLNSQATQLVNSFSYLDLDGFYSKLSGELEEMRQAGAEAIMLYIHWGDEYYTKPNSVQKEMAQALCDLGIDVIIGNHAHVAQPVELLTNTKDESQKTLCLYSTGNSLSNIRGNSRRPAETEDGMLFSVTFAKYSDGTVIVESAAVLPTWVNRYTENDRLCFEILTMEENWEEKEGLTEPLRTACQASVDRTMAIVGQGLDEANAYYAQNRVETEQQIGCRE